MEETHDYSDHNLLDVIDDDWSKAYIDDTSIIYKNKIYPISTHHNDGRYKPKTFAFPVLEKSPWFAYSTVTNVNKIDASIGIGTL